MFNVTEAAQAQVAEFFKNKNAEEIRPIRIFLTQGCGGAQLAMALDNAQSDDKVFKVAGFEYLVDRNFLKTAQPIEVDHNGMGFSLTSSLKLQSGGCGGCGSTGSCCS